MQVNMEDVKLPGPHTRMVLFSETVFKLKFKLSGGDLSGIEESLYVNQTIQKDIKEATASILAHICNTGTPIAVKTRHIVVYPGCLPWKSAVYNKLEFSHGARGPLKSHPHVIFLLIHIYDVPPRNDGACMEGDLKSNLGKHVRSSEDTICGQTEHAQTGAIRMPSARKRLKMDTSIPEEDMVAALPSPSDATLPSPTEHAQMDTGIQSAAARKHWRDETGKRQAFPTTERDGSDVKQQPLSLTHRIVRSIMSFIGWDWS